METFFIVTLSIYFGIGLYEFYRSFLEGHLFLECFFRAVVWPAEVFFIIKDYLWTYRNWK